MEKWQKIENFLDKINLKEIKNQIYFLYGYEEGYEQVPSENNGYLPFYDHLDMVIQESLLPSDSKLKPNTKRKTTKYITIHNTGMAHPSATAKGLAEYIQTTDRVASWHFSLDDKETYQHLGLDEVGWHAGDGSHTWEETYFNKVYNKECIGGGNLNSIGIESCVYQGVDFNMVMRRLAKLTAMLLITYHLTSKDVKQHYDFSGKNCPQVIREAKRWEEFLYLVDLELFAQKELQDVVFHWQSLTPEIMDNQGKIIDHPGPATKISYQVEVEYNHTKKSYSFTSLLLEKK
ncbi:MAG: N-acetylmuramoyl-L-alanine amidase [Bacilli bacterium]|jgi:N-acetylmuramoyl-L-alanine amidase|nr:N-acetylmuramoyl-L-alanine amidase [Bacilli bacterium]MDD3348072.1 N-acetylmuramoyl-L-alanine amidase [Bacilli bacterium]MDD4056338.1 N-acetylmuramoyl-L-alanine amidase [Bacilli bacterium]MDY0208968.1 N-acetylmuramoyl-L-alanine amidase [Bacilli bacterium]